MADDTDYEFIPKQTLDEMKKQLVELQRQAQQKEKISTDQFSQAIAKLTQSMEEMNALFKSATEELKLEETTRENLGQHLAPVNERLDAIEDQNKKIADAMLALADMIDEVKRQTRPLPKTSASETITTTTTQQIIPPNQQQMIRAPIPPMYREDVFTQSTNPFPTPDLSMPPRSFGPLPPPPAPEKRKGLFTFKK